MAATTTLYTFSRPQLEADAWPDTLPVAMYRSEGFAEDLELLAPPPVQAPDPLEPR